MSVGRGACIGFGSADRHASCCLMIGDRRSGAAMRGEPPRMPKPHMAAERAREMDDIASRSIEPRQQAETRPAGCSRWPRFSRRAAGRSRARLVAERMDGFAPPQVGAGHRTQTSQQTTHERLSRKLQERLAVIDNAQKNLTDLTSEVVDAPGRCSPTSRRAAPIGQAPDGGDHPATACPPAFYRLPADSFRTASGRTAWSRCPATARPASSSTPSSRWRAWNAIRCCARRAATTPGRPPKRSSRAQRCRRACEGYRRALFPARRDAGRGAASSCPPNRSIADLHEHFDDVVQRIAPACAS